MTQAQQLPKAVSKLPRRLRQLWLAEFAAHADPADEGAAYRAAWAAVRAAQKEKDMSAAERATGPDASVEKGHKLRELELAVERALWEQFADQGLYPVEVFSDHVIAQQADAPGGVAWWRIPFTAELKAVAGDPNGTEVVDKVTFAEQSTWVRVIPTYTEFKVWKQADGRARWLMVSSGGFEDRDREVVSTGFLESAVKAADLTGDRGPLLVYHIPGSNIGVCDTQMVIGSPGFLLESGTFDDTDAGRHAAAYLEGAQKEYGASIKFAYVNRTEDGVFLPPGVIVERSVLPTAKAAFPWSSIALLEVDKMALMDESKLAELKKIVGDDAAARVVASLDEAGQALKQAGIRWKEVAEAATEAEAAAPEAPDAPPEPEKAASAPPAPELGAMELLLPPETIAAIATAAAEQVLEGFKAALPTAELEAVATAPDYGPALGDLRAMLEKMAAQVEAMQRTDDEKLAEKVQNLPRATVKALQAVQRPTQRVPAPPPASEPAESMLAIAHKTLYGE